MLGPGDEALLRQRIQSQTRRVLDRPDLPRAGVLAALLCKDQDWHLLFAKRSTQVSTHQGQVAFPGGHVEPEDQDIVATALREAEEEVGLLPTQVEVLGLLNDVISITNVWVTPVLGIVGGDFTPSLDPSEVDSIFTISLDALRESRATSPTYKRETPLGTIHFPVFNAGPDPVWGLTAWMVDELLPLLSDPT